MTPPSTKSSSTSKSGVLSQVDVQRLLQNPSVEAKTEVLEKVSLNYSPQKLNKSELQLAEQIFRLLVQDSAIKIREALANNLKENPHVPKDIVMKLAADEESVSSPILSMSNVLNDSDLLSIIRNSEEVWRYLAIAERETVSETVSDALVDVNHKDVMSTLLDNPNAKISDDSYGIISRHAETDPALTNKLVQRPALPLAVVAKLSTIVSSEIAESLKDKYNLTAEDITPGVQAANEKSTLELLATHQNPEQVEALAAQLHEAERLSASLIINALCGGNIIFFEAALSRLSKVPLQNTKLLIADKGQLGFRALYNKAGLPVTMFKSVRLLLSATREAILDNFQPGTQSFSNDVVRRMLESSKNEKVENLSYILALLRQYSRPSF